MSMSMCEFVCVSVSPTDTVSPSWLTMSRLFPLKENHQTPHSRNFSLMMSEKNEKSFKTSDALDSRMVEFPTISMSFAPTTHRWRSFRSHFWTRTFSMSSV